MEGDNLLGYKKGLEVLMKSDTGAVTMYAEQAGFEHHLGKKIYERDKFQSGYPL